MDRAIITAVIAGFFALGGVYLTHYLSNKKSSVANVTGDEYVRLGRKYFGSGDYGMAITSFENAFKVGFAKYDAAEIRTSLGNSYMEADEFDSAFNEFKKAISLDQNSYKAHVGLGVVYRKMGDYEQATDAYKHALQIHPNYSELHSSLGTLYIFTDKPKEAINSFKKAIEFNPQLAVAHGNPALAYAMNRQFDKAEESLTRAIVMGYRNAAEIRTRIDGLRG